MTFLSFHPFPPLCGENDKVGGCRLESAMNQSPFTAGLSVFKSNKPNQKQPPAIFLFLPEALQLGAWGAAYLVGSWQQLAWGPLPQHELLGRGSDQEGGVGLTRTANKAVCGSGCLNKLIMQYWLAATQRREVTLLMAGPLTCTVSPALSYLYCLTASGSSLDTIEFADR